MTLKLLITYYAQFQEVAFMSFTVGNSFFTANISDNKINELFTKDSMPHMTLWEKIINYFFPTGRGEALICLHKLCNPTIDLTNNDIEEIFFRLKELASPGYKDRFCHDHIDSSTTGKLHIKGDDGDDLLYIEQNGELCNYTILGKTFIFDTPLIKTTSQETHFDNEVLSITFNHWPQPSPNPNIKLMINEKACISYKGKDITLNYTDIYDKLIRDVKNINQGDKFDMWKKEERTTYLSAVINKQIDNACVKSCVKMSIEDKTAIFSSAHRYLFDENLKLDISGAQPSIKNCVFKYINGESKINELFEKDLQERNRVVTEIVNRVSDRIYEDIFNAKNGLIEELTSHVRTSCVHYAGSTNSESH